MRVQCEPEGPGLIQDLSAARLGSVLGVLRALAIGILLGWAGSASAGGLSLQEAIEIAQHQARSVIRIQAEGRLVNASQVRARAAVLPSLNIVLTAQERFRNHPISEFRFSEVADCAGIQLLSDECQDIAPISQGGFVDRFQLNNQSEPRFDLVLSARQLLYDGGRAWGRIEQVRHRKERVAALHEAVLNNVRLDVVRAYYRLESAIRAQAAFEARVGLGQAQLARARTRLNAGKARAGDVATAQRNLAQDRVTLARRVFATSRQRRALNLALARPADTAVRLSIPARITTASVSLSSLEIPSKARVERAALVSRPDLRASRLLVKEVQENVDIQNARYGPTLVMDASYRRGSRRPDRVVSSLHSNYSAAVGLTLRWSVFEGFTAAAQVQQAEAGVVKVQADLEELERRILSEVYDRLENLALQIKVYDLARDARRLGAEAAQLARAQNDEGHNTALELRDAELKFTNAQLALINARLQVEVAREELRRACGADLMRD